MDCISLKNLKFRGYHGYHPEERENGNTFEIDITFHVSLSKAAADDDLLNTIDYSQAANIVEDIIHGESVKLIESLLYAIGEALTKEYPQAHTIEVAVRKLNPPMPTPCAYTEVRSQWPK